MLSDEQNIFALSIGALLFDSFDSIDWFNNDLAFFFSFVLLERSMRPSESSIENDSIVFTYTQRFSKMPNDESVTAKRASTKRPVQVAGLSIDKNDSEEQNKDVNSSDTENASPAITYGPKDMNSV